MPGTMESGLTTSDLANAANGGQEPVKPKHEEDSRPLLEREFSSDMRTRWEAIQTEFVDDPQVSVKEADELVANAMKKLAESFAEERRKLEQQWSRGTEVSTEDLRQALQRYRAFFHRLLAA